jgi:DNA-directed RNA polymerase I subunit RPA1
MRLSFPEAVTPHNVEHLRQLVRNGAHKYPGALAVEDCTGRVIQMSRLEEKQREALAKQLMLPSFTAGVKKGPAGRGKTVYRCVCVWVELLQQTIGCVLSVLHVLFMAASHSAHGSAADGLLWCCAVVGRRMLLDGDVMLTNRQPTLHKPSLMAHK